MNNDEKVEVYVINNDEFINTLITVDQESLEAGLNLVKTEIIPTQVYAGEENVGYLNEHNPGVLQIRIHSKYSDLVGGSNKLTIIQGDPKGAPIGILQ